MTVDKLTKNKFANDEYMMNCYENLKTFTNNWSDSIKPENASDYVYAIWYSSTEVRYATQPYELKF